MKKHLEEEMYSRWPELKYMDDATQDFYLDELTRQVRLQYIKPMKAI